MSNRLKLNKVRVPRRRESDAEKFVRLEREIARWLRPLLQFLPESQAWLLDLHFGVTQEPVSPHTLAQLLGVSPREYIATLGRLLCHAQAAEREHFLSSAA